jgi:A/G-specific adenine glycosylase
MAIPGKKESVFFTKELLKWNKNANHRQMPWKNEKDPYKIWLSEIILQQTRVEQGTKYYERFVSKFPTIQELANASDTEVFKLWEGLGYYSRCRNLLHTARFISNQYKGVFPSTHAEIIGLKGIGTYTAAAIASFAFSLPYSVVDGNVLRVLSRYFAIKAPIDDPPSKKKMQELADSLLDKKNPGIYNQAIMDFGATICKPQLPLCSKCYLNANCKAFQMNKVDDFPVKIKQLKIKERWFNYIIATYKRKVYVRLRTEKDIWQNLYEFVLVETAASIDPKNWIKSREATAVIGEIKNVDRISGMFKQQLTHQTIRGYFFHVSLAKPLPVKEYEMVPFIKLKELPFPRSIAKYLSSIGESF